MTAMSSRTRPASQEEQTDVASPSDLRLVAEHRREVGGSLSPLAARIDHLADALDALREAVKPVSVEFRSEYNAGDWPPCVVVLDTLEVRALLDCISTLTGVTTHE